VNIGLLECDHVRDRYRGAAGGDYADLFERLFADHVPELVLKPYDVIGGELPGAPDECDGWVCTGSRHGAYDGFSWIDDLSAFIGDVHGAGVPFAGICFGHQVLAQALGGRVAPAATGWGAGIRRLEVVRSASWMAPPAGHLDLHFMHQDQVVELPPGAVVLARAGHCPVAMFEVGTTTVGIQAHPEFTSAYSAALLADREERIGGPQTADALATLGRPADEAVAAQWIGNLLGSDRS
jgi:GMP synthase-like glutamine amidotransferase